MKNAMEKRIDAADLPDRTKEEMKKFLDAAEAVPGAKDNAHLWLVKGGGLRLGTWQGVFRCEFDGPRRRTVHLKVIPG